MLGRYLSERDDQAGAPTTVMLSYALWQTDFGGDASVLGKSIILDDKAYTVIGVMPADFHFPNRETQFWKTFQFQEDNYKDRDDNWLIGIGRLKPGVSLAQARTELRLIGDRLRQQYPKENQDVGSSVSLCATNSPSSLDFCSWLYAERRSACWSSPARILPTCCWCARWRGKRSFPFGCRWAPTAARFCGNCSRKV